MTTAEKCAHSLRVVMGESADTNAALLLQLEGGGVTLPPMPLGDDLGEGGIERGGYDEGSQLSAASPGFGSFDDSGFRLAEEEGVGGGPGHGFSDVFDRFEDDGDGRGEEGRRVTGAAVSPPASIVAPDPLAPFPRPRPQPQPQPQPQMKSSNSALIAAPADTAVAGWVGTAVTDGGGAFPQRELTDPSGRNGIDLNASRLTKLNRGSSSGGDTVDLCLDSESDIGSGGDHQCLEAISPALGSAPLVAVPPPNSNFVGPGVGHIGDGGLPRRFDTGAGPLSPPPAPALFGTNQVTTRATLVSAPLPPPLASNFGGKPTSGTVVGPVPAGPLAPMPLVSNSGGGNLAGDAAGSQCQPLESDVDESDDDIEFVGMARGAPHPVPPVAAQASYQARASNMPPWMANREGAVSKNGSRSQVKSGREQQLKADQVGCGSGSVSSSGSCSVSGSGAVTALGAKGNPRPLSPAPESAAAPHPPHRTTAPALPSSAVPFFFPKDPSHIPTWMHLLPPPRVVVPPPSSDGGGPRAYRLSLLSVTDFTVTAVPFPRAEPYLYGHHLYGHHQQYQPPNLSGLRPHIRRISREYGGTAEFEKDEDGGEGGSPVATVGGGRWRIPLAAYQAFHAFLCYDRRNSVEGIPEYQLKIASLGRERKERGYPTVEQLMKNGMPRGLASALAPYQRGGVDFVLDREGRALIADEMGLGKTVQAIAAMACYEAEWPVLVLSPSSARYHWELEFRQWLGKGSSVNTNTVECADKIRGCEGVGNALNKNGDQNGEAVSKKRVAPEGVRAYERWKRMRGDLNTSASSVDGDVSATISADGTTVPVSPPSTMALLSNNQIHVLTSSKDKILPSKETRVVICSYGLAPNLISSGAIRPGMFRCVIVDESHMLKNKSTKRTKTILPILKQAARCVMLSGTPAMAKPMELWPQLSVLGQSKGWWTSESEFVDKYVKGNAAGDVAADGERKGSNSLAELHTLLTSTVMIRRMKVDMLKSLPKKIRLSAQIHIKNQLLRDEFKECMEKLREGKGVLGKLAREQKSCEENGGEGDSDGEDAADADKTTTMAQVQADLSKENERKFQSGINYVMSKLRSCGVSGQEFEEKVIRLRKVVKQKVKSSYDKKMRAIEESEGYFNGHKITDWNGNKHTSTLAEENISNGMEPGDQDPGTTRKAILSHLYNLTGMSKISTVVQMLRRWLDDPTKGKLCIFAHHISVLDAIQKGGGFSNEPGSRKGYMRIDGSTQPRHRQEAVSAFQTDPNIRVALLGITAAGVAVTLTASSDVWFVELFWTPAMLVQAEDRCHRIGQQAAVKILYFIGRGTLDEVLWKLIEKKFRDLGEFVEGKENLDMVIHRAYECGMDVLKRGDESDGEEDDCEEDEKKESLADLAEESTIQHEIEELAMEEQHQMKAGSDEDDEDEEAIPSDDRDINCVQKSHCKAGYAGKVMVKEPATDVICLSDDDCEETDSKKEGVKGQNPPKLISDIIAENKALNGQKISFDRRVNLPFLRLYSLSFSGPSYGLIMTEFKGRVVIKEKHPQRKKNFGEDVLPDVGDILLGINNYTLPYSTVSRVGFENTLNKMKVAIKKPPVQLVFGTDKSFKEFYRGLVISNAVFKAAATKKQQPESNMESVRHASSTSGPSVAEITGTGVVIELLDDN